VSFFWFLSSLALHPTHSYALCFRTPNFLGVIPGGQSFAVPAGDITNVPEQGTGFSWKPPLRGGTTLFLLGGDNRGNGTGGSNLSLVGLCGYLVLRESSADGILFWLGELGD